MRIWGAANRAAITSPVAVPRHRRALPRDLRPPTRRQTVVAPPRKPIGGTPKKQEQPAVQKPIMVLNKEMLERAKEGPVRPENLHTMNQKPCRLRKRKRLVPARR